MSTRRIGPSPVHAARSRPRKVLRKVHPAILAFIAAFPLALSSAAIAADIPVKAPAATTYNWAGCYIGANGGGAESGTDFATTLGSGTPPHLTPADVAQVEEAANGSANSPNFVGGGQIGCNGQSGTYVYGIEGDFDYFRSTPQFVTGSFPGSADTLADGVTTFTVSQSLTTNYLASLRPRVGIAADRNLFYVTAGAAFTSTKYTLGYVDAAAPIGTGIATGSRSMVGWTAGAGWEYAWNENWIIRFEYLFSQFQSTSSLGAITDAAGGSNPLVGSANLTIQTARAGVNYKF